MADTSDVKNLFDAVLNYVTQKTDDSNAILTEIREKFNAINGERDANSGIQGIHDNIDRTFARIEEIGGDIGGRFNGVDGKLSELGSNVAEILRIQRDEISGLRQSAEKLAGVEAKLSEAQEQIKSKDVEIADLSKKIEDQNAEIKTLQGNLKSSQKKFDDMQAEEQKAIDELKKQLADSSTEREDIEKNLSVTGESLTTWRESVKIYIPVRKALAKCATFKNLLEARGLTDDSEIGILAFVREIGTGKNLDFLDAIYEAAKDLRSKQPVPQPMTSDEVEVYNALNQCYRQTHNINHDVFTTPGSRNSIAESFEKIPFSAKEASALKTPTVKNFKFTKKIYVPMLVNEIGTMKRQALVEASNI